MSKTSGHTTAKITSQHGIFYNYLVDSYDKEFMATYLKANEEAIRNIESIVNLENIDCDFERKSAFVFTKKETELEKLKNEAHVVKQLNIAECNYVNKIDLNIDIKGAVEFKNQAQFNPIKYTNGLINVILQNDCQIFEDTKFENYEKEDDIFKVFTNTKNIITCKHLVITTRYPVINFPRIIFFKNVSRIILCYCN